MADIEVLDTTEAAVSGRVDAVIADLTKGRVIPKQVDQLADAVSRSRMDKALSDALNRRF